MITVPSHLTALTTKTKLTRQDLEMPCSPPAGNPSHDSGSPCGCHADYTRAYSFPYNLQSICKVILAEPLSTQRLAGSSHNPTLLISTHKLGCRGQGPLPEREVSSHFSLFSRRAAGPCHLSVRIDRFSDNLPRSQAL